MNIQNEINSIFGLHASFPVDRYNEFTTITNSSVVQHAIQTRKMAESALQHIDPSILTETQHATDLAETASEPTELANLSSSFSELFSSNTARVLVENMTHAIETYRSYDRSISGFVREYVERAQEFSRMIQRINSSLATAITYGSDINAILNHTLQFISSVDWDLVNEQIQELQSEGDEDLKSEISTRTEKICTEVDNEPDQLIAVLARLEKRLREPPSTDQKIRRRDIIIDAVLGMAIYDVLIKVSEGVIKFVGRESIPLEPIRENLPLLDKEHLNMPTIPSEVRSDNIDNKSFKSSGDSATRHTPSLSENKMNPPVF